MLKDWRKEYRRLKRLKLRMSETKLIAQAKLLVATPDERWKLHQDFWRSRELFTIEQRRKAGWGETYEEQKNCPQALAIQKEYTKYVAAEHGFEP